MPTFQKLLEEAKMIQDGFGWEMLGYESMLEQNHGVEIFLSSLDVAVE